MLIKQDFINNIKHLGLNSYEAKIWVALLSRGVSSAGELSDISQVPRSRVYDVLESLERKGFILVKLGKPIKYIAVHPQEVISRVKKRNEEELQQKMDEMEKLKTSEVVGELEALYKTGITHVDPENIANSIRGKRNIYSYLAAMIKNAEKSVTLITTPENLAEELSTLRSAM